MPSRNEKFRSSSTKNSKEGGKWGKYSMYPELHERILPRFLDSDTLPAFYNIDEDNCVKKYDTHIMGRFYCHNEKCETKNWGSKMVAIRIRLYSDFNYNAVVYHQLCKNCNQSGQFYIHKSSYVERVSYRLRKWAGLNHEKPVYDPKKTDPHIEELCEGCEAGRCTKGENSSSSVKRVI